MSADEDRLPLPSPSDLGQRKGKRGGSKRLRAQAEKRPRTGRENEE